MTCEREYFWYYEYNQHYIGKTNISAAALGSFHPNDNIIRGLAWDGTFIWTINTSGVISSYNKSGMLQQTLHDLLPGGWGICWGGTFLWASDPGTDKIYQISLIDDGTPPEPPVVLSLTHPVPTIWYSDPNPLFLWSAPTDPSGIDGYSYLIDGATETVPDDTIDGTDTTAVYTLLSDGPWYFHCRARDGAANWSDASHYRILIDTTPPDQGTIVIDDGADTTASTLVTLGGLTATDLASGMGEGAAMTFSNDSLSWSEEESFAAERTDWDLTLYGGNDLSGVKRVYVVFKDVAGNRSDAFYDDIVYNAPLFITTESLAAGTVGFAYAETLSATGGWPPYRWDISDGSLPPGLYLTEDGILSGEPESEGDFTFTVKVTDSNQYANSLAFRITVSYEAVKGDINGDALIDILDLVLVVRYVLHLEEFTEIQLWAADVYPDSVINVLDALGIVNIILGMPMAKAMPLTGGASVWIDEISQPIKGEHGYAILLDSPDPVGGVQLSIKLPEGSRVACSPQSRVLTVSWEEAADVLRILLYSLDNAVSICSGSQPLLNLRLADAAGPVRIERVLVSDGQGRQIQTVIKSQDTIMPTAWVLRQNYPNPFNPETVIGYQIPDVGYPVLTSLIVYNLMGQEVKTLVNEYQETGNYAVTWDGQDKTGNLVPSGVYFCKLEAGETSQAIKMILSK